jgi:hypothetical protein
VAVQVCHRTLGLGVRAAGTAERRRVRHVGRQRHRAARVAQARLLLDGDAIEHLARGVLERMHDLHAVVQAVDVVLHLGERRPAGDAHAAVVQEVAELGGAGLAAERCVRNDAQRIAMRIGCHVASPWFGHDGQTSARSLISRSRPTHPSIGGGP